jgi:ribosomal-protein-alanine N-acetyltransferase
MGNSTAEKLADKKSLEAERYLGNIGKKEAEYIREAEGRELVTRCETIFLHTPDDQTPDSGRFRPVSVNEAESEKEHGIIYITDDIDVYSRLASTGKPVIIYENDYNCSIDFTGVPYIIEEINDIPERYFSRIYRRLKKLPWDILQTDRLSVRETVPTDVPDFYRIYKDPEITEYMEGLNPDPITEIHNTMDYIENVYCFYEYGIWTVILRETGEIIGRAGIEQTDESAIPSLGFVIGRKWQKNGYATEVCRGIIKYAENVLRPDFLRVCINENNKDSINLCRKLGFEEPGIYMEELGQEYRNLRNSDGLVNLVRKTELYYDA